MSSMAQAIVVTRLSIALTVEQRADVAEELLEMADDSGTDELDAQFYRSIGEGMLRYNEAKEAEVRQLAANGVRVPMPSDAPPWDGPTT